MADTYKTIQFPSKDGLTITADYYPIKKPKGYILLCHRSHFNRGEYRETAPKLNKLGFSCLAIDQRSGMKIYGVTNETQLLAKQKGFPKGYLTAKPDIKAGIEFLYKMADNQPIILFGSSYSASLALIISLDNPKVKAIAAFSPIECLKGIDVAETIKHIDKPIFITSSKKEIQECQDIVREVNPKFITPYIPITEGFHGSKMLWERVPGWENYWVPLEAFLANLK